MNRSHLYFRNPLEGVEKVKLRSRYNSNEDSEKDDEIDISKFDPQKDSFATSRDQYLNDRAYRESHRNPSLDVPVKIEYIIFEFFDYFNTADFEIKYYDQFGLSPVKFSEFNTKGIFAVVDEEKFKDFFKQIENFIKSDDPLHDKSYNHNVRYIKEFSFLSSQKIINYKEFKEYFILELVDFYDSTSVSIDSIRSSLINYLSNNNILSQYDSTGNRIELFNISKDNLQEIIDNFDIIHTVNSPSAGTVKPSAFNLPVKDYGFEISNPNEDLPIIGVIDTGVSAQTPLAPIIINSDNTFDITNSSPKTDNANHGTAVAAFAALGNSLIPNHQGKFKADAKILSIKVLNSDHGFISESEVIRLISKAHNELGIKIFVLTIGHVINKNINSEISNYAYLFDFLSHTLDILIFISVGNHSNLSYLNGTRFIKFDYPQNFEADITTLCTPAESMNNISCGAVAENYESFDNRKNFTLDRNFPACYSRKFHIDTAHPFFKNPRKNKQLIKPDVCYAGGDYDEKISSIETGIKVLSSDQGKFFERDAGTSYSAPLLANIAAKIYKQYPNLKSQTVKALIINSAQLPKFGDLFNDHINIKPEFIAGRGNPDVQNCLFSNDDEITLILESEIKPDEFKAYPIKLPDYLLDVDKKNSIVTVNATLSFSFEPYSNDQLVYCPIYMSFGIFKNRPLYLAGINKDGKPDNFGINGGKVDDIKVKNGWSQDYYFKPKLLSNCQKISFNLSKENLVNENGEFKIAVKCQLHKLLPNHQKNRYLKPHNFSLVISIKENPIHKENTGRLYNEMILENNLEAVASAEIELDTEI